MSWVHDNIIKAYKVDFEAKTLVMNTFYDDHINKVVEDTDVIFTGYLAHCFEHEITHNIIFDIEEYPMHLFVKNESELLKKNKNHCWPICYKTENELIEYLQKNEYKIFAVDSSCGLTGRVIAKQMEIVVDQKAKEPAVDARCETCMDVKLYEQFSSPGMYMACNNDLRALISSGGFELTSDSTPLDQIKNERGGWVDDTIRHVLRCKTCGQHFTCTVDTYHGGGSFRKGN
ncbi:MAG: hypothetical protein FWE32_06145 [Oscillospiraceae bacterium]|nr:hypothetical protein [Oscillospiraceae bacterium]